MAHQAHRPLTAGAGVASPHIQVSPFPNELLAFMAFILTLCHASSSIWRPVCQRHHGSLTAMR